MIFKTSGSGVLSNVIDRASDIRNPHPYNNVITATFRAFIHSCSDCRSICLIRSFASDFFTGRGSGFSNFGVRVESTAVV